ncbi:MAG TPA: hypothetical protein VD931_13425, partial [Baekduia sp.]|nr:hypothetical protein [Baekduia sp.]
MRLLLLLLACALSAPAAAPAAWEAPVALSPPGLDVLEARAAAGAGRLAATWTTQDAAGARRQWLSVATPDGPGAPLELGPARGDGAVAVDRQTGDVVAAWADWDGDVHAAVVPAGTAEPGPAAVLGTTAGPVAVAAGAGRVTVAWVARAAEGLQVRAVRSVGGAGFDPGAPATAVAPPFAQGGRDGDRPLELLAAAQPAGGALLAWTAGGEGRDAVALRSALLPAAGDPAEPQTVSDPARSASGAALAADSAGHAVLAWVDAPAGWFTGRVVRAVRAPLGRFDAPVALGADAGATLGRFARNPAVAVDVAPAGAAAVAWNRADDAGQHSFAGGPGVVVRGSAHTGAFGAPEPVPGIPITGHGAAVARDDAGRALVGLAGGSFTGAAAAVARDGEPPQGAAALECPGTWAAPVGAAWGPDGEAAVLWRHDHPARDVRALLLSRSAPGPDEPPCPRLSGTIVTRPAVPRVGQEVLVDARAAVDPEASQVRASWRVDPGPDDHLIGGGTSTGDEPLLRHTFTTPGPHVVDLDLEYQSRRGTGSFTGTGTTV